MESKDEQLAKAEELFTKAFNVPREPRSDAYKRGVMAALIYRFAGIKAQAPYKEGTAELDAFLSGCDEGHRIWRTHTAEQE